MNYSPYQGYFADNPWCFYQSPPYNTFTGNEWSHVQNHQTRRGTRHRGGPSRRRNARNRGGYRNVACETKVKTEVENYLDTGIQDSLNAVSPLGISTPGIEKISSGKQARSKSNKTKTNHAQLQTHKGANTALKICLDTPEQIAQWREERRKNYPSASNIAKKQERSQAKQESGQTAVGDKYRYVNSSWKCDKTVNVNRASRNTSFQQQEHLLREDQLATRKEVIGAEKSNPDVLSVGGSLGALSDIYGAGSSDEEVGEPQDTKFKAITVEQGCKLVQPVETVTNRLHDVSYTSRTTESNCKQKKQNTTKKRRTARLSPMNTDAKRRKPSLLQMLLTPDIRHERNILLQCIRHIVRNDFFASSSHK